MKFYFDEAAFITEFRCVPVNPDLTQSLARINTSTEHRI